MLTQSKLLYLYKMLQKNIYFNSPEYGKACLVLDFNINSDYGYVLFEKQGKKFLITRPSKHFEDWKDDKSISLSDTCRLAVLHG